MYFQKVQFNYDKKGIIFLKNFSIENILGKIVLFMDI